MGKIKFDLPRMINTIHMINTISSKKCYKKVNLKDLFPFYIVYIPEGNLQ